MNFFNDETSTSYNGGITTDRYGNTTIRCVRTRSYTNDESYKLLKEEVKEKNELPHKKTNKGLEIFFGDSSREGMLSKEKSKDESRVFITPREMSRQGQLQLNILARRLNEKN